MIGPEAFQQGTFAVLYNTASLVVQIVAASFLFEIFISRGPKYGIEFVFETLTSTLPVFVAVYLLVTGILMLYRRVRFSTRLKRTKKNIVLVFARMAAVVSALLLLYVKVKLWIVVPRLNIKDNQSEILYNLLKA